MRASGLEPGIVYRLRRGAWFGGLPEELQEFLLSRSVRRRYERGQLMSAQGSPPVGLFGIIDGQVAVSFWLDGGEEALIHIGEPGLWIGETGLFQGRGVGSLTAHSAVVEALVFPAAEFERSAAARPDLLLHLARLAVERFQLLLRWTAEQRCLSPEERLRKRLAVLAELARHASSPSGPVELSLSQAELGQLVGLSRQSTNELLRSLADRGLIELGWRRIRVLDRRALLQDPPASAESA